MSADFMTEEELAELEAELNDLPDDDESDAQAESEQAVHQTESESESDEAGESADLEAEIAAELEQDEEVVAEAPDATESAQSDVPPDVAESHGDAGQEDKQSAPVQEEERDATQATVQGPVSQPVNQSTEDGDKGIVDPAQLTRDLAFSPHKIDDAFMEQSGFFAHYAMMAAKAERQHDRLEQQEKLVYARLDSDIREEANNNGEKITEGAIKNRILQDKRHRAIVDRKIDARMHAQMAKSAAESFRQRRDMLIQMGADLREEHKGDLRMKAASERRDDLMAKARTVTGR